MWSSLHCASCYIVGKRTGARLGWACAGVWQGSQGRFWGALSAFWGWGGIGHGDGSKALTGACRGLYGGLGVWDAVQRDSGAASGARVDAHRDAHRGAHRGAGRVVWSGAGLGHLVGAGRGLGACRAGQGRGQRDRGGQCARLDSETGSNWGGLGGVKDRVIYPHVCIGHITPSRS